MMHTSQALYDQLHIHLLELNKQIEAMVHDVQKQVAVLPYPDQASVYTMKNVDGTFVMGEMLAAKAQVLSGMAALKAADLASKTKAGPGRKW